MQTNVQPEASAPMTDGVVIRTEGLTKVYDTGVKAVDALDLEVHEGEIFGLLGPNGAGKTTTVGMLTTRVIPTEGRATVAGVDVVAHPSVAKALMGVVSQTNTLDRSLTVWENLYFHGRYFGMGKRESKRVATQMLEVFRLADRARRRRVHPVRRHGAAADGRAEHRPPAARRCSWTSRLPAWTRSRGSRCGRSSGRSTPKGRPSC